MGFRQFSGFLIVALIGVIFSSSEAYKFYVGGKNGWVLNPSESYCHWAERNRFLVNDTLYFKYDNGTDSVLIVKKEDFDSCNTKNPILTLKDGESEFKFDRSGPFYFISGNADHCQKGQKLIIVVLSVNHKHHNVSTPSPSPVVTPPPQSPSAENPSAKSPDSSVVNNAPAPAPAKNSGLRGFDGSVLFRYGVGISALVLSSLVGLF